MPWVVLTLMMIEGWVGGGLASGEIRRSVPLNRTVSSSRVRAAKESSSRDEPNQAGMDEEQRRRKDKPSRS